ncbi:MAG: hypothetical protein HND47_09730 [Chloroflexi bacterium]|nr:hypothetical protein [Chloroflexota bacterium]
MDNSKKLLPYKLTKSNRQEAKVAKKALKTWRALRLGGKRSECTVERKKQKARHCADSQEQAGTRLFNN